ncbi:DUF302 domain-containing protein [Bradymonadaceae bacterium TMQ3]|uniref:DUF302 domain-containing protein n=1 Tax=Lujinxingia sediminis TaxID=2480984 RepID=A0ABY0CRX2_9DELT|nr:DUF302 domain-containing protein [Lujinxingia sediminis]RDV36919.1 DUF302 domain-containing protein [Bradymonadaceae bacterium TMQ3]RVU42999.1 DUF302 domain-containing protein [Lujinxingia sediminis]TXC73042.1 DUF302 domain-containing protein [Bradymonadales bacterium TMQ1]
MSSFGNPDYGITATLKGVSFTDAIERTEAALKEEGFGVLTRIDIKDTLRKKLDVEHKNYVILGACNPPLAHQALQAEAPIGLLLPCNVVVTEDDEGNAIVSALDPVKMFSLVERDDVQPVATEVKARMERVIGALQVD